MMMRRRKEEKEMRWAGGIYNVLTSAYGFRVLCACARKRCTNHIRGAFYVSLAENRTEGIYKRIALLLIWHPVIGCCTDSVDVSPSQAFTSVP